MAYPDSDLAFHSINQRRRLMEQLAPSPSQAHCRPIPYGLVSLWDMINWSLSSFVWAMILVQQEAHQTSRHAAPSVPDEHAMERIKSNFDAISSTLRAMFIADGRLGDIAAMLRGASACNYGRLAHEFGALESDIRHAIETERFYHYPKDKGLLVVQVDGDWATVITAFPSTRKDIEAATDCFAMGHANASIYHCMMILERGLPAFARRLRVTFSRARPTWDGMIKDIRKNLSDRRSAIASPPRGTPPRGRVTKAEINFLDASDSAATEFKFFENAWRNHIAHGRADYDASEAQRVLNHTRLFMETIATKLKLKERRP